MAPSSVLFATAVPLRQKNNFFNNNNWLWGFVDVGKAKFAILDRVIRPIIGQL
jgi:hypothetical protein